MESIKTGVPMRVDTEKVVVRARLPNEEMISKELARPDRLHLRTASAATTASARKVAASLGYVCDRGRFRGLGNLSALINAIANREVVVLKAQQGLPGFGESTGE